jgi:hypothetical protein
MHRPCHHPGCSNLVVIDRARKYCDDHSHKERQRQPDRRDTASPDDPAVVAFRLRCSPHWRKVRKVKLSMSPLCEDPHGDHKRFGVTTSAEQVHHIEPIGERPDLAFTMSNLMSVCVRCHAKLSGMERRHAR